MLTIYITENKNGKNLNINNDENEILKYMLGGLCGYLLRFGHTGRRKRC
jgi:hypothetical protein